jgi:hypothetical protein
MTKIKATSRFDEYQCASLGQIHQCVRLTLQSLGDVGIRKIAARFDVYKGLALLASGMQQCS